MLSQLMTWASSTEQALTNQKPVSRDIDVLMDQVDQHKALQQDFNARKEELTKLENLKNDMKLTGRGNKKDLVLVNNLVSNLGKRFDRIQLKLLDRNKQLEAGQKETKMFYDAWQTMMTWLDDTESQLDKDNSCLETDAEKIRSQLHKHRELQRVLGSKRPTFDGVVRLGRTLKDKSEISRKSRGSTTEPDLESADTIQAKLTEIKAKWTAVCGKSVDRQKALEDAMLVAGQFRDALQLLLDWLYKVEPSLSESQPVNGDRDTVASLIEAHKSFQKELTKRTETVASVRQSAKQLLDKSPDEAFIQKQLINLTTRWESVCRLSVNRQQRLEDAYKLAEEFHSTAHGLLDTLASLERSLRYHVSSTGQYDSEAKVNQLLSEHELVEAELQGHSQTVDKCKQLGGAILLSCHSDATPTVKHWLATLAERWAEVQALANQRRARLNDGLAAAKKRGQDIEHLMTWLNDTERTLTNKNNEPLPENIPIVEQLLHGHLIFESEIQSRHEEVEKFASSSRRNPSAHAGRILSASRFGWKNTPRRRKLPETKPVEQEFSDPQVAALFNRWRKVWLLSMDRHKKLQDMLDRLNEIDKMKSFNFDDWRIQYMKWMKHNKSRVMDFFYRQDKDHDGKVTRQEFIDGILKSGFPTTRLEMEAVADKFDENGDGYIDYREFIAALRWPDKGRVDRSQGEKIQDEVHKQAQKCVCPKQYHIHKVEEGKYRFGESQKLRLVRILRSTVMVRVGGGWVALDEFLVKNDPCRAKGRTNMELREQFILPAGASQSMSRFISRKTPTRGLRDSEPSSPRETPPPFTRHAITPTLRGEPMRGAPVRRAVTPTEKTSTKYATTYGPVMKVREKTIHDRPWRQSPTPTSQLDREVTQILQRQQQQQAEGRLKSTDSRGSRGSSASSDTSDGGLDVFTAPRAKPRRVYTTDHTNPLRTSAHYQQTTLSSQSKSSKLPRTLPLVPPETSFQKSPRPSPAPSSRPSSRTDIEAVRRPSSRADQASSRPGSRVGGESTSRPPSRGDALSSKNSSREELDNIRLGSKARAYSKPELSSRMSDAGGSSSRPASRPASRISQTLPDTPAVSSEAVSEAGSKTGRVSKASRLTGSSSDSIPKAVRTARQSDSDATPTTSRIPRFSLRESDLSTPRTLDLTAATSESQLIRQSMTSPVSSSSSSSGLGARSKIPTRTPVKKTPSKPPSTTDSS